MAEPERQFTFWCRVHHGVQRNVITTYNALTCAVLSCFARLMLHARVLTIAGLRFSAPGRFYRFYFSFFAPFFAPL